MTKVVDIGGNEYEHDADTPSEAVVELACLLKALAEDGDIQSLVVITGDRDDGCQGYVAGGAGYNPFPYVGAMELVKGNILAPFNGGWEYLDDE